ncbi:AarF/ABC1/UbiB kinase family protein [Collinsella sp. AGMB00827]|uniref:AarF/ABC1/UbiB kinase family protein n=1 Tax=Collinsella ureilytica TaxID=2869515 RepID=A0ABS7MLL0_9ACTN|nr:AarF/UbiB family protein [Collinsella urealyticum]MBY4798256.1 AarF/ABC1/UbiB kinase family protein [Collinsella urealyticum]
MPADQSTQKQHGEEAQRTSSVASHRVPRAVDAVPGAPSSLAPSERYQLTRVGRRARIGQIFKLARTYEVWRGLTPERMRSLIEDLGPMFVKMGQILATRSEILPQEYCDELGRLRTEVEPVPFSVVRDCLEAEYGIAPEHVFAWIAEHPLGSASLAQVHRARLVTGEDVAVKVQRPGAQQIMAQDIDIMRSLARHVSRFMRSEQVIDFTGVVEELWQSFREETNFLMEAKNLEEFYDLHVGVPNISCPRPYTAYCTEHIVVMDYIEGISVEDPATLRAAGFRLHDIGSQIVEDYAQQVLDDGFFHADPHAGNIIVSGGVIYFIDLGMVGRMGGHDRSLVQEMIFSIARGNVADLKDALMRFAVSRGDSSELDHAAFLTDLDYIVSDFAARDLQDLDVGGLFNALVNLARKNDVELPSVVTMFARGLVTLEGLLSEYLPDVNMIEIIARHMSRSTNPVSAAQEMASELKTDSWKALKSSLVAAGQLDLASRMLTRGQLKINTQLLGSEQVLRHIGGIIDRLSMAIVVAGLFIGSSVVYYAKIEPVIFGIPVIGFLGYSSALVLALGLGREIWRNSHGK